ncbi:MAG: hypothetical protein CXR31_08815 [Geobacter sp.]|nr:MAG: hypothetical protein CXR31_08815 [Geobacter sp.]
MANTNWNETAKRLLKAELARRNISHKELAARLQSHGVTITRASIDSKLSRGTFSAAFFLQCLTAIETRTLNLED